MGTYKGTGAADTITPDQITGGVGRVPAGSFPSIGVDVIDGLAGDDVLNGGGGADTIRGGDGDDRVFMELFSDESTGETIRFTGTASLYGDAGNDTMSNRYDGQYLNFDAATFRFFGGTGNDQLAATYYYPFSEYTNYGAATDFLYGGAGDDSYTLWESSDVVVENLNEGYDIVKMQGDDYTMPANVERLELSWVEWDVGTGFRGTGNGLDNTIIGSTSGDTLDGAGGNDTIFGGEDMILWRESDPYYGYDYDTIRGGDGNDILYGGGGPGITGDGDDILYGDLGSDTIYAQRGDDKIYGGRGEDDPGDGPDTIYGDIGNDDVWAGGGDDVAYGGDGNDNLYGQSDNDTLWGGSGNDRVYGGTGTDTLHGDEGSDNVRGGAGSDICDGGAGRDRYDYDDVTDSALGATNRDVILAFDGLGKAAGDWIDLASIDANPGVPGNQAFAFKGAGALTGAGQVHVVASGEDTLVQANTVGSLEPELEILVKDGAAGPSQWVAGDFIL